MLFRTKTSIYELKNEEAAKEGFLMTKIALLPGCSSSVKPGTAYRGDRIVITPRGLELYDGDMFIVKTSSLQI